MFVFTTKINKSKIITFVLLLAALIAVILIVSSGGDRSQESAVSNVVKNNEQRIGYLSSFGWEVSNDPIEEQTIVIPKSFDDTYSDYNELQLSQGFDLSKYGGLEAVRYTYNILNYPSGDNSVVADIIVYRNQIIAGDVQSTAMDGFMIGLEYPK